MNFKTDVVESGFFKLDYSSRKFFISDTLVELRNKEFAMMMYFLLNPGRVLTRTEILECVWDRNICCPTNTVDVHISVLRNKLKKHLGYDPIRTIYCVGYVFEIKQNY